MTTPTDLRMGARSRRAASLVAALAALVVGAGCGPDAAEDADAAPVGDVSAASDADAGDEAVDGPDAPDAGDAPDGAEAPDTEAAPTCGLLTAVDVDGATVCLGPTGDDPAAACPAGAPHRLPIDDLLACADDPDAAVSSALSAACGPSGAAVSDGAGAGCLFITETGFTCPPFLLQSAAVGDWTVCGGPLLDAGRAVALAEAFCGAAGPSGALVTDGVSAGCAVAITETGFDCPPPTAAVHGDDRLGVCGAVGLGAVAVAGLRDAYCAPDGDGQYLVSGGRGMCAYWITETGFRPCPALHGVRRVASPFGLCAGDLVETGPAAFARAAVCGDEGVLADIGRDSLCAYAITETGFLCPPLMSSPLEAAGGAVCGRDAVVAGAAVDAAEAFAQAPRVCAWQEGVDTAFDQRLGGVGATPRGTLLTGSVSSLTAIGLPNTLPDAEELLTDAPRTVFSVELNVNGTLSGARILGRSAGASSLYACGGQAMAASGSVVVATAGHGVVTFGEGEDAEVVDLGEAGNAVARFSALGRLEAVMVVQAPGRPDWRDCALGVHADGAVTLVYRDEPGDAPGEIVRFDADGGVAWRRDAPAGTAVAVAAHPGGAWSIVGRAVGAVDLGGQTVSGQGAGDGFVARYDAGGELLWAGRLGGTQENALLAAVAVDEGVIVAGYASREVVWDGPGGVVAVADGAPSVNVFDTVVMRLDGGGGLSWVTRARSAGNNEGRGLALGLDGDSVHLAGVSAGDAAFGAGDEAPAIAVPSTLYFYAGYAASFGLADGAARTAWVTSDAEPYFGTSYVVGHVDGTTTHVSDVLGVGEFGAVEGARETFGKEINRAIVLVHTPADGCP